MQSLSKEDLVHLREGYNAQQRLLQLTGITLFFGLTLLVIAHLVVVAAPLSTSSATSLVFLALISGYLFADLSSGIVHWFCDNYGSEDWPFLGPAFIRPFRHHHVAPQDLCEHGFVQLNGNNCLVSLPMFWVATLASPSPEHASHALFAGVFCLSTAWFVFGTNQFHAWAHCEHTTPWVRWLQNTGLVLSPAHHSTHHEAPYSKSYCITSGSMDILLSRIGFFRKAEGLISLLTNCQPLHQKQPDHREPPVN